MPAVADAPLHAVTARNAPSLRVFKGADIADAFFDGPRVASLAVPVVTADGRPALRRSSASLAALRAKDRPSAYAGSPKNVTRSASGVTRAVLVAIAPAAAITVAVEAACKVAEKGPGVLEGLEAGKPGVRFDTA